MVRHETDTRAERKNPKAGPAAVSVKKKAVMDLVEKEFDEEPVKAQPGSVFEKTRDLCGIYEGADDLSTNPKYMEGDGR